MRVRVTTPILGAISKQSHIASDTCARAWQAAFLGCAVFTGNFIYPPLMVKSKKTGCAGTDRIRPPRAYQK